MKSRITVVMRTLLLKLLIICLVLPSCQAVLRKSSECKRTLGCVTNQELTVMLSWQPDSDRVHFQLRAYIGPGDLYVAMGLSDDEAMGGDSVTECVHTGGVVSVQASYNIGKRNERYVDAGLFNKTGYYENGTIICTFTLLNNASTTGRSHNLLSPWHVLLAWGPVEPETGRKMQHYLVSASAVKVNLQATGDFETERPQLLLVKIHGSLMMLAWVMLTSLGIIVARYFKDLAPESTFCGQKMWFQIHRTVMVLVSVLTAAGFAVIFVHVGGYRQASKDTDIALILHPILGIAVTALCLLNPVIALFRPHPGTPKRPIFNWVHRTIGTTCYVLAAVTLFLGLRLKAAAASFHMLFILGGFFLWHIILEIIFLVQMFGVKKQRKRREFQVSTIEEDTKNVPERKRQQKVTGFQEVLLMMHCAVSMATTILLLAQFLS